MFLHEITGRQLRDAREALGLSLSALAARSNINRVCIRIYESFGDELPSAHTHTLSKLTRTLQDGGVVFEADGTVRLRDDHAKSTMKAAILNQEASP
jgi:hypothetical protein